MNRLIENKDRGNYLERVKREEVSWGVWVIITVSLRESLNTWVKAHRNKDLIRSRYARLWNIEKQTNKRVLNVLDKDAESSQSTDNNFEVKWTFCSFWGEPTLAFLL